MGYPLGFYGVNLKTSFVILLYYDDWKRIDFLRKIMNYGRSFAQFMVSVDAQPSPSRLHPIALVE